MSKTHVFPQDNKQRYVHGLICNMEIDMHTGLEKAKPMQKPQIEHQN